MAVSVINTVTDTVVGTITVGGEPMGVAFNQDGSKAYVANHSSNTISVIDTTKLSIVSTINVIDDSKVLLRLGNSLYASCSSGNNVKVIDLSSNTITSVIVVDTYPDGLSSNPTGTKVYVACGGSSSVSVIDVASNSVTATIATGSIPHATEITPDGKYIYVACEGSNSVNVVDATTNQVFENIPVGYDPYVVGISGDGKFAYSVNYGSSSMSVIDISTNMLTKTIDLSAGPYMVGTFMVPTYVASDVEENSDTTSPILSSGSATRTSNTEATVTFTSDEGGDYYYGLTSDNDVALTIDTSGVGTACTAGIVTITNPAGLAMGAKDLYIKVKDVAGNVSDVLKIDIAAYTTVKTDVLSAKYTKDQLFDVQRSPAFPKKDSIVRLSGMKAPYDQDLSPIGWEAGDYVRFEIVNSVSELDATKKNQIINSLQWYYSDTVTLDNAAVVKQIQYDSNGIQKAVLSDYGLIWALDEKEGFLYTALGGTYGGSGGIGTFVSFKPYVYGSGTAYVATSTDPLTIAQINGVTNSALTEGTTADANQEVIDVIIGKIVDAEDDTTPITDAIITVTYNGNDYTNATDINGNYIINVPMEEGKDGYYFTITTPAGTSDPTNGVIDNTEGFGTDDIQELAPYVAQPMDIIAIQPDNITVQPSWVYIVHAGGLTVTTAQLVTPVDAEVSVTVNGYVTGSTYYRVLTAVPTLDYIGPTLSGDYQLLAANGVTISVIDGSYLDVVTVNALNRIQKWGVSSATISKVSTYTTSGTIKDTNNNAVSGAAIVLTNTVDTTKTYTGTTESNGNYSITNVPNGSYTITVTKNGETLGGGSVAVNGSDVSGESGNVTVTPGTQPVSTYTTSGTIKDTNNNAVSGAEIVLTNTVDTTKTYTGTTDTNGDYSIVNVPNGSYTITVTKNSETLGSGSVTVNGGDVSGDSGNVTITPETQPDPTYTITGTTKNTNNNAVSEAEIVLTNKVDTSITYTGTTDTNGNYSIVNVPNGSYTIAVTKNSETLGSGSVTVNGSNVSGGSGNITTPTPTAPTPTPTSEQVDKITEAENAIDKINNSDKESIITALEKIEALDEDELGQLKRTSLLELSQAIEMLERVTVVIDNKVGDVDIKIADSEGLALIVTSQELKSGEEIIIKLTLKNLEPKLTDISNIEKTATELGKNVGGYVDITLTKQVGNQKPVIVSETQEDIYVCIEIPEKLRQQNYYQIVREHNNEIKLLYDTDNAPNTITVPTNLFSTYAIAYTEALSAEEIITNGLVTETVLEKGKIFTNGLYTYEVTKSGKEPQVTVLGLVKGQYAKKVVIAATVDFNGITYTVTSIQKKAFYKDSRITSVSIGKNVMKIGTYAFKYCNGITKLVIGDSVTTIGRSAFYGCSALRTITIGTGLKTLEEHCFCQCTALKTVTIKSTKLTKANGAHFFYQAKGATFYLPKTKINGYKKMISVNNTKLLKAIHSLQLSRLIIKCLDLLKIK